MQTHLLNKSSSCEHWQDLYRFQQHWRVQYLIRTDSQAVNHTSRKPRRAKGPGSPWAWERLHFPAYSGSAGPQLPACMRRRHGLARAPPHSAAAPPLPLALSQWEGSILQGVTGPTPPWSCKSAKAAGSSYSAEGDASPARGREAAGGGVRERGRRAGAAEGRPEAGPARGVRASVTSGGAARASLPAASPQAQRRPRLPAPARPPSSPPPLPACLLALARSDLPRVLGTGGSVSEPGTRGQQGPRRSLWHHEVHIREGKHRIEANAAVCRPRNLL